MSVNTETTRKIVYLKGSVGCYWDYQLGILQVDPANLKLASECLAAIYMYGCTTARGLEAP